MGWIRSRLFWKITGLYALLSGIALIGLLLMLNSQLETQSSIRQQAMIQGMLDSISQELLSGRPAPDVMTSWTIRMAESGATLWMLDDDCQPVIAEEDPPPDDITVRSVVQTALRSDKSVRSIRIGAENQEHLAIARALSLPDKPGTTQILLVLVQPERLRQEFAPIRAAAGRSAVFTWAIGILCMSFVAIGIVGPLHAMSVNLHQSIDGSQREDMLLTMSDRQDELGRVAHLLHELEEERQDQIRRLQSAERIARSSADLLTTVLDSMIEGVIAVDTDHRIVFLNTGARRLLSISPVIGVGQHLYEAIRVPAFIETVGEAISTRRMQTLEYRATREQADLVLVVIPILKGPHAGAVAVVRDVSELRRLEAMRRDFVSGVSHELKTPLTVIQACTDTLLAGAVNDPADAERFLKQIDEQSERLLQLILGMLQLARVESGQQVLHAEPVDVQLVVDDALRGFRTVAESRSVQLTQTGARDLVLMTDYQALQTILSNLVDNALKHTNAGGSVVVELFADANTPAIVVRDTGTGIPDELLGRIFERFYRVERDRSRERGGSGLGLAIVKHLCQALGATISVKSEVSRGSEFRVEFRV